MFTYEIFFELIWQTHSNSLNCERKTYIRLQCFFFRQVLGGVFCCGWLTSVSHYEKAARSGCSSTFCPAKFSFKEVSTQFKGLSKFMQTTKLDCRVITFAEKVLEPIPISPAIVFKVLKKHISSLVSDCLSTSFEQIARFSNCS
ncbi:hypothetical protein ACOSQ2_030422 [Xanthoceras sorbifolium]